MRTGCVVYGATNPVAGYVPNVCPIVLQVEAVGVSKESR